MNHLLSRGAEDGLGRLDFISNLKSRYFDGAQMSPLYQTFFPLLVQAQVSTAIA